VSDLKREIAEIRGESQSLLEELERRGRSGTWKLKNDVARAVARLNEMQKQLEETESSVQIRIEEALVHARDEFEEEFQGRLESELTKESEKRERSAKHRRDDGYEEFFDPPEVLSASA
jgi:hypothetical protein